MELSNSLTEVTLHDIKWAVDSGYNMDIKWVAMNVISILSNKDRTHRNKQEFKHITGKNLYCPTSSPACGWSGSFDDVVDLVSVMCKKSKQTVFRDLYSLTRNESNEISIRLRYFSSCKINPVYGESAHLKKDDLHNYYMWDYNRLDKLTQIPEQLMKEKLIVWQNRDLLYGN